jgi:uncharacterized protein
MDPGAEHRITTVGQLREIFAEPSPFAVAKEITALDDTCRAFLAACPFVALGTTNPDGTGDVSPKGGTPGFIRVLHDTHVAWGDLPGNNRLDGYTNLLRDDRVGMLCIIPGMLETLRINGTAIVTTDPVILAATQTGDALPRVAVVVSVREAFVHCSKALRRSSLWDPAGWPDLTTVPSVPEMLLAHRGEPRTPETIAAERHRLGYR